MSKHLPRQRLRNILAGDRCVMMASIFDPISSRIAGEIGAESWAEFLLKFIVSYPGMTCAIPATSKVAHVRENMRASRAPLPDEALRKRMIAYVEEI